MKTYENDGNRIFYWKICNIQKRNETIEKIIYNKFSNIVNEHRKKRVIVNTLSLLLIKIFISCEKELFSDTDKRRWVFENWYSYKHMKNTGLLLNFSNSHTKNEYYMYGDIKIYHRTLAKILDEMEQKRYCVRRNGYFCMNKGYNSKFQNGFWLFNWQKFYELYAEYRDKLNLFDVEIDNYSPVVIKRKIDGNYKNCTNEYNIDLLFKEDIEYINKLRSMYSEMNV